MVSQATACAIGATIQNNPKVRALRQELRVIEEELVKIERAIPEEVRDLEMLDRFLEGTLDDVSSQIVSHAKDSNTALNDFFKLLARRSLVEIEMSRLTKSLARKYVFRS